MVSDGKEPNGRNLVAKSGRDNIPRCVGNFGRRNIFSPPGIKGGQQTGVYRFGKECCFLPTKGGANLGLAKS